MKTNLPAVGNLVMDRILAFATGRNESFWVKVEWLDVARLESLPGECVDVPLLRQQKPKQTDPPVNARLLDA